MSTYWDVGVSSISLGISCGEGSVDENEGAQDLGAKAVTLGVAMAHKVGPATKHLELRLLESFHHCGSTDRT